MGSTQAVTLKDLTAKWADQMRTGQSHNLMICWNHFSHQETIIYLLCASCDQNSI
jgi:hypothetical protein